MADHSELVAEMQMLEKLGTQERMKQAKKRRMQQLKRWSQREKEFVNIKPDQDGKETNNGTAFKNKPKYDNVHFIPSVMLLEAASRNDVEEGEQSPIKILFSIKIANDFFLHIRLVRRLLKLKVDPDSTNEDGLTALHQVNYSHR